MLRRITCNLISLNTFFLFILFSSHAAFGAAVSGSYQTIASGNIIFDVKIGQPAPSSLIIQHFHSPGASLSAVSPQAAKINRKNGFVKWFIKNPRAGKYTFSLVFLKPLTAEQIRLILRYKDPASGKFEEVYIQP